MADAGVVYIAVSNIPAQFRSSDLRNYFSQFIEGGGFVCFHYRHRPEVLRAPGDTVPQRGQSREPPGCPQSHDAGGGSSGTEGSTERVAPPSSQETRCCVVAVRAGEADRLVKMYAGNQWVDADGSWLGSRCVIRKISVSDQSDVNEFPYKTKAQQRRRVAASERFTEGDLKTLPEMNPPALMPNGNVGTPVTVFLQLIQACRLPPRLIRQLGLSFPKTGSRRRYGNVPFEYRNTCTLRPQQESVYTAGGVELSGAGEGSPVRGSQETPESGPAQETPVSERDGPNSNSDDDDDTCEEWERHEALSEDVTRQDRCEERLFEERIELKWEKGGSGLVFYTDAQYWKEEQGDFDEQTSDDWDVDMSVYYDKDGGDKDARDYIRMRHEQRLRAGLESGSLLGPRIGGFEKFTKGVGRRLMEQQGWREGQGLGHSRPGIAEALESEGQHPNCKRGFGYHGEKISSFLPVKKPRPDFLISTVYDQPREEDSGDSLLRRQQTTSMKYRHWQPGGRR
ncbi:G patch domain-containing protein 3 [Amia ocellicauda]|uniref:G patch domain-containing protein 3 n=1 Tax=Amia ocellicauda TaxID=2972642 RepID=UPI003463A5F9